MNRRVFLSTSVSAVAGTIFSEERVRSIGVPIKQEPLAFDFAALEPYLDAGSVRAHYEKIHADYTTRLQETLGAVNLEVANLTSLISCIKTIPTPSNPNSILTFSRKPGPLPEEAQKAIRTYGGGHLNHTVFWRFLAPHGSGPAGPEGRVAAAIQAEFGGIEDFRQKFTQAALTHAGPGWVWLVYRPDGRLVVTTTSSNDHPMMKEFVPEGECGRPILCLDLWDHALSLRFKNNRQGYVAAWWKVVNWAFVSKAHAIVTSV